MPESNLLFVNDHGQPVVFCTVWCVRQRKLNKVIKENGGCVTEDIAGPHTIVLEVKGLREGTSYNNGGHSTFSPTYIKQCISRGKLLPLQRFWVTKDPGFDDTFSPNDVMLRKVTWSMCRLSQSRAETSPQPSLISREKKKGEKDTETHTTSVQATIQVQPCSVVLGRMNSPVLERMNSPVSERMSSPLSERTSSPVSERTSSPVSERTSSPVSERTSSPVSERTSSPVSERTSSPVSERTSSPVSERTSSPVSERTSSPVSERINSPVSERMSSPASERINSPVSERMSSPVLERINSSDKVKLRECSVALEVMSADEIKKAHTSITTTLTGSTHLDDIEGALSTQDGGRSPVSPHTKEVDEDSDDSTVLFDLNNSSYTTHILSSDEQSSEELDNGNSYLGKKSKGPVSKWKGQHAEHQRKCATSEDSTSSQSIHSREVQPRPRWQKRKKREDCPRVEEEEEEDEDENVVVTRNVLRKPNLSSKASQREKQKGLTSPCSRKPSASLQSDDNVERDSTTRKMGIQREAPAPHHGSGWISRLTLRSSRRHVPCRDSSASSKGPLFKSSCLVSKERRGAYTITEDLEILDYIVQKEAYKQLKGRAFWVSMAESFNNERTWQGLKERFRMRIMKRLGSYVPHGLDPKVVEILNHGMPVVKTEARKNTRNEFMRDEDLIILKYIIRHRCYRDVSGLLLWRNMAKRCPELGHHTWQSLRERFIKKIIPNIHHYGLTKEEVLQFKSRRKLKEHQRQWLEEREKLPSIVYKRLKTPKLSPRKAAIAALHSRPPSGAIENNKKTKRQERYHQESDSESSSGSSDDLSQPHTLAFRRNKVTYQHHKKQQNKDEVNCQERLHEESDEESSSDSSSDLNCPRTLAHLRKKFTHQRHKKQQDQDETMEIFQQSKAKKRPTTTKRTSANGDMSQSSAVEEISEAPPRPKVKRLLPTNYVETLSPKTPYRKGSLKQTLKIKDTSNVAIEEAKEHRKEKLPQEIGITTAETSTLPTKEGVTDSISDLEDATEELPDLNITERDDANSQEERVEDSQDSEECQGVRSEENSAPAGNPSPGTLLKLISSTLHPLRPILNTPTRHQDPHHPSHLCHTPPQNSHPTTCTTKYVTHNSPSILPDTPLSPVIPLLIIPQLIHPTPPQNSHLSNSPQHSQTASTSHINHSEMGATDVPPPPASKHTHPSNSPPPQHNSPSTLQPTLPRSLSTLKDVVNEHSDSSESSTVDVVSVIPRKKSTHGSRRREGLPSVTSINNLCRKLLIKRN